MPFCYACLGVVAVLALVLSVLFTVKPKSLRLTVSFIPLPSFSLEARREDYPEPKHGAS